MNKLISVFILTLATVPLLDGCRAQTATPLLALPSLQRPVVTLKVSASAASQRLFIPVAAYVERSGLPGVFVLNAGQARFRMVRIGKRSASQLEVLSGLSGDETLVLRDLTDVHDGSPIVVR